tara:strand:+ start:898 stop:1404 length:507 start_codon:yes stop_codon:yes gene_type:complete
MCLTKPITPTYNLKIVGKYECPISKVFHNMDLRKQIFFLSRYQFQLECSKNFHKLNMILIEKARKDFEDVVWNADEVENHNVGYYGFPDYLHEIGDGGHYYCSTCKRALITSLDMLNGFERVEPIDKSMEGGYTTYYICKSCNWKRTKRNNQIIKRIEENKRRKEQGH